MEHADVSVRGEEAWKRWRAIGGASEGNRLDCDGDGFAVIATERFFYRHNPSLQPTSIFELIDDTTCKVTLISGGGAAGLVKDDLEAESTALRTLVRKFEHFGRKHDLEIER